jgi:hypothetical protein
MRVMQLQWQHCNGAAFGQVIAYWPERFRTGGIADVFVFIAFTDTSRLL